MAFASLLCGFQTEKPAVLASGDHESGAKVELLSVKREAPEAPTVVTMRWRYRNEGDQPERLTKLRTGSIDAYRLLVDTYLLDEVSKTKFPITRDSENHPVGSRNGMPNEYIVIKPKTTVNAWGKYFIPENVSKVTVAIDGVEPFSNIAITK
ncbi:MAG: hypothetical protein ACRD3B_11255 [Candidatus Sulfotelmatobacter sp.]